MTNETTHRWGRAAILGAVVALLAAMGCGRGLLGISSTTEQDSGVNNDDASPGSKDAPPTISVCFPDHPASCDAVCLAAATILENKCGACHGDNGIAYGDPNLLLDATHLTMLDTSGRFPGARFVVPGDPDDSLLYHRAVVTKDMPPPLAFGASEPSVSEAEGQVLHDWIAGCMGPDNFDAGTVLPPPQQGVLVPCPAAPPSGSCAVDRQGCAYPDRSCVCDHGTWSCDACPAQQPAAGTTCAGGLDAAAPPPPNRCRYGAATCSCDPNDPHQTQWGCGACPASEPTSGNACGNAAFSCSYGNDDCSCVGGSWDCRSPACPVLWTRDVESLALCQRRLACQYPGLGTSCACDPESAWSCSCPASLPAEGDKCTGLDQAACSYSDQSCRCTGGIGTIATWHCMAACPASAPGDGTSCHSNVSCTYGGGLCYCDGTAWQCS